MMDELYPEMIEDVIRIAKEVLPEQDIQTSSAAAWAMNAEIRKLRDDLTRQKETTDYWRKMFAGTLGINPVK
jgi:hypothetical protein